MKLQEAKVYKYYKKHEGFIMAVEGVMIILLLSSIWFMFYQDSKLKEEINLNCGWGEDNYYCYCEKSKASEIKNKIDNGKFNMNVTWDFENA